MRVTGFEVLVSITLLTLGVAVTGCSSKAPAFEDRERPVTYRLDDAEAQRIYQEMAEEIRIGRWRDRFDRTALGRDPVILVGRIRNETDDFIDTRLLTKRLERAMLDRGGRRGFDTELRVVSDPDQRDLANSVEGFTLGELVERARVQQADFVLAGAIGDYESASASGEVEWVYEISLDVVSVIETGDINEQEVVWTKTVALPKTVE